MTKTKVLLTRLEEELETLKTRAQAARGSARKQAEADWHDIEHRSQQARKKLDELQREGSQAYQRDKLAMKHELDDIEAKLKKLRADLE